MSVPALTRRAGGQRHRLALARVVYSDSDVLLLDDPLHAVDTTVARLLFERCIRGLLRDKAVVLVTHQLQFLADCDDVLLMKDGRIAERGTLAHLLSLRGGRCGAAGVPDACAAGLVAAGAFAELAASTVEQTTVDDAAASAGDGGGRTSVPEERPPRPKQEEAGKSVTTAGAFFQLVKAEDRSTGTVCALPRLAAAA